MRNTLLRGNTPRFTSRINSPLKVIPTNLLKSAMPKTTNPSTQTQKQQRSLSLPSLLLSDFSNRPISPSHHHGIRQLRPRRCWFTVEPHPLELLPSNLLRRLIFTPLLPLLETGFPSSRRCWIVPRETPLSTTATEMKPLSLVSRMH